MCKGGNGFLWRGGTLHRVKISRGNKKWSYGHMIFENQPYYLDWLKQASFNANDQKMFYCVTSFCDSLVDINNTIFYIILILVTGFDRFLAKCAF